MDQKTTTIRISIPAHNVLRERAYNERRTITDIIDEYVGVKKRSHHKVGEVDTREKHIRVRPLTTLEKLLLEQKKKK